MKPGLTGVKILTISACVALIWYGVQHQQDPTPSIEGKGCGGAFTSHTPASGRADIARTELAKLVVRVEDSGAHYNRDDWMPGGKWRSLGKGKTTRTQVLARDRCDDGSWTSPYDGHRDTVSSKVQIDHIVPLKEAEQSGARAQGWSNSQRNALANDVRNLRAVSAHSNESKSDRDPAEYKPTKALWCGYAEQYIGVKYAYHLTVDHAEKTALTQMINTCKQGA